MKTKLSPQDKAERTTQAANTILNEERLASDAKVARLKALRLAKQTVAQPAKTPAVRRPKPAARSLAFQESPPARKRK